MSSIRVSGNTSGYYDLTVPDVAGTNTIPLNQVVTTDANGNLGVGTSSPAQKLVVSGGTSDVSVLFNSTDTAYYNFGITKSGSLVKMGEFNNDGDTHQFPILSIEMNGDKVRVGDSTIGNEPLNVTFNGRGGIQVGSKTGEGAYIVLDGPNNGDGGGGDYAYIEHNSSGVLNFNVGNSSNSVTTRMAIHPEGYILHDSPRFATRINYTSGFRSAGSAVTNWQSPHVNDGNAFNYSNGRFTAPVAGTYRFDFHTNVLRDGTGVYYLEWYKNGSTLGSTSGGRIYDQWDGGWANACGFIMVNLSAGDYVELYHTGGPITLDGNSYGQYTGYLVG